MSSNDVRRPVTAVIVTYRSAHTVLDTLAAARRCHDAQLLDCIVVDNGSDDGTLGLLSRDLEWASTILTGRNNGFGRGCNIGLNHVTSPYTIFINPDAAVEPDALRTMMNFMQANPQVGIVGPATITGSDHGLQGTGAHPTPASILRAAIPFRHDPWTIIVPGAAPFRTGWVCGAVFMMRTELMKRLGGFDPRFFMYWEETDVCKRSDDLGFETWAVGTAVASHHGGASSVDDDTRIFGCIGQHFYQSRRYYMLKHHGWLAATIAEIGEIALLGLGALYDVIRGRSLSRIRPRLQATLLSQPQRL